jgi:hypothetical protein
MTELITFFLGNFLPIFLFCGSLIFSIYVLYIFIRCIIKIEKLSESLTEKEKQYFYLAITYLLTFIIL